MKLHEMRLKDLREVADEEHVPWTHYTPAHVIVDRLEKTRQLKDLAEEVKTFKVQDKEVLAQNAKPRAPEAEEPAEEVAEAPAA